MATNKNNISNPISPSQPEARLEAVAGKARQLTEECAILQRKLHQLTTRKSGGGVAASLKSQAKAVSESLSAFDQEMGVLNQRINAYRRISESLEVKSAGAISDGSVSTSVASNPFGTAFRGSFRQK